MYSRELKVSQTRLWSPIEERCQPGANVAQIDQRIWDLFGEQWAVMFTDLSGFSRRVEEFGIIHFLQIIHEQHKILLPIVERHDGLLVKEEGDSLLILITGQVRDSKFHRGRMHPSVQEPARAEPVRRDEGFSCLA